MEIIKINDIEYVKKEELDKLQKDLPTQKDYIITDPCNVLGIVPLTKKDKGDCEIIELTGFGTFKKFTSEIKLGQLDNKFKPEIFYLDKSKYSFEYLQQAIKTAKEFSYESKPEFYRGWDKDNFIEDYPCLIKMDNLCFILAPRITGD